MVRKVVGKINRELNRELSRNEMTYKAANTAKAQTRQVSPPRPAGLGPIYKDKEDF